MAPNAISFGTDPAMRDAVGHGLATNIAN
jgi:hypothetical protein